MIKEIKKAFIDSLPKLSWMDEATRKAAISKVGLLVYDQVLERFIAECSRELCESSLNGNRYTDLWIRLDRCGLV